MKNIFYQITLLIGLLVLPVNGLAQSFTPINPDTTRVTSTCSVNGGNFHISVPHEVLSGDMIPLNITLPGTLPDTCQVTVSIQYSSPNNKLQYGTSSNIQFYPSGNNTVISNVLAGNNGYNFNVFFKFPNHVTCDGEVGTFQVTFDACGASCTTTVNVTARAANYWTVKKEFIIGDLTCGVSKWRIKVMNNNPNPSGHGNYKIQGTITENTTLPVLSNAVHNVSGTTGYAAYYTVTLQNCQNAGTVITNQANYNFTLGDGCDKMNGIISADSPPLQSPNANISFTKGIYSSSGYYTNPFRISAGCDAYYKIRVNNTGNVPWIINSITDIMPSQITVNSISEPGFTHTVSGNTYTFTPSSPPMIINPGEYKVIVIYFTVNSTLPTGTIVSNTAYLNYNGTNGTFSTGGGGNNNPGCSGGINCPTIDTTVQTDTTMVNFKVVEPFPKEIFRKCITNRPPNSIYNIGDTIHFKYIVGNSGSGVLNTVINDNIGLPGQNLQIIPSSVNYNYYEDEQYATGWVLCNIISNNFTNQTSITNPFSVSANTTDLQHPVFTISNMPGICQLWRANYLVIEFDAVILSQIYGHKVNTATTSHGHVGQASYNIDQIGILAVTKRADQEFVDNNGNFNYIIEVTNNGSVPLDHIAIYDQLPSCVQKGQDITATDFTGNPINVTISGNLTVSFPATWQLMPGETATVNIPVTKISGGNCCNESVRAQGTMTTSGTLLEANYGSSEEPAACVKSSECCDIPDFQGHLYENSDGTYSVSINSGDTPIQQVDISVVDYHVEYNHPSCRPADMGIFGTLSTQDYNLNGLVLDSITNNTTNLTWLPGNPAILNNTVNFSISKPGVLDVPCCKADFYFCIKVSVKDVNCNVCEKVLCVEEKPSPCNIQVEDVHDSYCIDDTATISWTSTGTSGVDIYVRPAAGGSMTQIATNQPPSGTLNWTIPYNINPCDRDWVIIVADKDNPKKCFDISNTFPIKCCVPICDCGKWRTGKIVFTYKPRLNTGTDDWIPSTKHYGLYSFSMYARCSETVYSKLLLLGNYRIEAPLFQCIPKSCQVEYKWSVRDYSTGQTTDGTGKAFTYTFDHAGKYKIVFTPVCGGKNCKPCFVNLIIKP